MIICGACEHFPCQTAEVSESALHKAHSLCRLPGKKKKKNTLVKQHYDEECIQSAGEPWKGGFSSHGFVRRHRRDAS